MIDDIRTERRKAREKAFPHLVGIHIGEKVKVPMEFARRTQTPYAEATVTYIDKDWNFITVLRTPERGSLADPYARNTGYKVSVAPGDIQRGGVR